jgi:septal ring factor EnvC (AmiA/AmiB activator)
MSDSKPTPVTQEQKDIARLERLTGNQGKQLHNLTKHVERLERLIQQTRLGL